MRKNPRRGFGQPTIIVRCLAQECHARLSKEGSGQRPATFKIVVSALLPIWMPLTGGIRIVVWETLSFAKAQPSIHPTFGRAYASKAIKSDGAQNGGTRGNGCKILPTVQSRSSICTARKTLRQIVEKERAETLAKTARLKDLRMASEAEDCIVRIPFEWNVRIVPWIHLSETAHDQA